MKGKAKGCQIDSKPLVLRVTASEDHLRTEGAVARGTYKRRSSQVCSLSQKSKGELVLLPEREEKNAASIILQASRVKGLKVAGGLNGATLQSHQSRPQHHHRNQGIRYNAGEKENI